MLEIVVMYMVFIVSLHLVAQVSWFGFPEYRNEIMRYTVIGTTASSVAFLLAIGSIYLN
jgi:hypothetical protein